MKAKTILVMMVILLLLLIVANCCQQTKPQLTDEQINNIIKCSYQYVEMYNVNNKFALKQGGWMPMVASLFILLLKNRTSDRIGNSACGYRYFCRPVL